MAVICEYLGEVVTQCVGIAILVPEIVAVKVCRLVLDCRSISHIVCGKTVETVVFL